jgi:uncharacterized protein
MDYMSIIKKHYTEGTKQYDIYIKHCRKVAEKALKIASNVPELKPDLGFIMEAAILHDIGIKFTNASTIDCHGTEHYLKHLTKGKELLEDEGYPKHANVCLTHSGVGISKNEIIENNLPLPKQDLYPNTIEEEIISLADLFYSKDPKMNHKERTIDEIKQIQKKRGLQKYNKLIEWLKKYKLE